jgi:hypothetical protein
MIRHARSESRTEHDFAFGPKILRFSSRPGKAAPGRAATLARVAKALGTMENKRAGTAPKRRLRPGLFSPASSSAHGYFARISHGENTFAHDGG